MTLSSVTNTAITRRQAGQQKTETAQGQSTEKKNPNSAGGQGAGKVDDTVSLSQLEKASTVKVTKEEAVEEVLPRTRAAIMKNSKLAIATQANVKAETARDMLA